MPRYFFNTRLGDELISDPEGEELRNPDRAWEIARAMIRELLKTEDAGALLNAVLEVTDDTGDIVLEFPRPAIVELVLRWLVGLLGRPIGGSRDHAPVDERPLGQR